VAISGIPIDVPVLILAGGEDPVARPDEAQAIFERVRSHGKLILFEHAGHMNFPEMYPDLYQRSVLGFFHEISKLRVTAMSMSQEPFTVTLVTLCSVTSPSSHDSTRSGLDDRRRPRPDWLHPGSSLPTRYCRRVPGWSTPRCHPTDPKL
jgi:hypothetical protein